MAERSLFFSESLVLISITVSLEKKNAAHKKIQLGVMFLEKKKRQVVLVGERLSVLGKLSPAPLWDANMDNLRVIWRISDFLPSGTAVNADN